MPSEAQRPETVQCRSCGDEIRVVEDEWWSHRWDENPSQENVEKAREQYEGAVV